MPGLADMLSQYMPQPAIDPTNPVQELPPLPAHLAQSQGFTDTPVDPNLQMQIEAQAGGMPSSMGGRTYEQPAPWPMTAREHAAAMSAGRGRFDPLEFMVGLGGAETGGGAAAAAPIAAALRSGEQAAARTIRIPLEHLEHGEAAMPGGSFDLPGAQEKIADYASRKTPFPPISVVAPEEQAGAKFLIEDGSHRVEAAKLRGDTSIRAEVPPEWADLPDPQLKAKASMIYGKWAKYSDEYPPVGQPALIDKASKKEIPYPNNSFEDAQALIDSEAHLPKAEKTVYFAKKATPEVDEFLKDRQTIMDDMATNGFEPYFDPAKRSYVNPKEFPTPIDTATAAGGKTNPAKPETLAKYEKMYDTPGAAKRLVAAYKEGVAMGPGTKDWYAMNQLLQKYIEYKGPVEGRAAFKTHFADAMSSVTAGQKPDPNLLMAHWANFETAAGRDLPQHAYEVPYPVGGQYGQTNVDSYRAWKEAGFPSWDVTNPKRADFSGALAGNKRAFTVDEVMSGLISPTGYGKTGKEPMQTPEWYGPATRVGRDVADKLGIKPAQFQDRGWAGARKMAFDADIAEQKKEFMAKVAKLPKAERAKAIAKKVWPEYQYEGPMISNVNNPIERTRRLTGQPVEDVVKGYIMRNKPLYAIGAGALPLAYKAMGDLGELHDRGAISDEQYGRLSDGQR